MANVTSATTFAAIIEAAAKSDDPFAFIVERIETLDNIAAIATVTGGEPDYVANLRARLVAFALCLAD